MPARGYEFYLLVFNSISRSLAALMHHSSIVRYILGDPGADSGGEGKSKRATKKIGEEKSRARGIAFSRRLDFSSPIFFVARLDFPSPPLSAPASPRM